ncbi:ABC-2 family transporter protein [Paenibacillus sp. HWE-109]|uniref:ABC transporter permease n=1 Tax=Paenibacillus sp. HWE-109 TaxID=1306526 RepID=UPI001EDE9752|nr:ABC-2 family transporter protein [Paenibacillus sp. HWE-109]UKS28365.1 ABC-2 family transporter protein [Paenibacillus sp. HWE-109]
MSRLPLYLAFIRIKLNGVVEYRGAFLLTSFSKASVWVTEFLLIYILISKFKQIAGWGTYEVMFLYALSLASYSFAGFFLFHPCMKLASSIQSGEFDEILTKPINPFLYLICKEFSTGYFNNVIVAIGVMIICFNKLQITLSAMNLLFLVIVLIGGTLIQGAAFLFTSVPAFWITNNKALIDLFMFDLKRFIQYPISAYSKFLQVLLTLLFPYAFINFYPAQYFLKKNDFLMFHPWVQFLTPIIGIVLFTLAILFFFKGIKHYNSTGS